MGALGGAGGGGSYAQDSSRHMNLSFGPVGFGDTNVGAGAGSGLKFTPMMLAIVGGIGAVLFFIWKRS
jgi:hypothetical protein